MLMYKLVKLGNKYAIGVTLKQIALICVAMEALKEQQVTNNSRRTRQKKLYTVRNR